MEMDSYHHRYFACQLLPNTCVNCHRNCNFCAWVEVYAADQVIFFFHITWPSEIDRRQKLTYSTYRHSDGERHHDGVMKGARTSPFRSLLATNFSTWRVVD